MNFANIFPTAVGYEYNQNLAESILPIAKDYLKLYGTTHEGCNHITTYFNNEECKSVFENDVRLKPVYDFVSSKSIEYLKAQNIDVTQYKLKSPPWTFFASVGKNSQHQPHTHPNSLLSCILYLSTTENCPPIIFNDPRPYYKYVYYHNLMGFDSNSYTLYPEYVVQPKTGMFLIWPAWLEHQVPLSQTDDERITMVFNIDRE
jgi:hypothetical protein